MNKLHHTPRKGTRMNNPAPMAGTRVRLVSCSDPYTTLPRGTYGTVRFIDDVGTVHVAWDNGATLGMVRGYDRFEVVRDA